MISVVFQLELITSKGYPGEEHWVTTPDGYILGLHRISGPGPSVANRTNHTGQGVRGVRGHRERSGGLQSDVRGVAE